jgi:DNA (cytosine-5)-methyltransferase 1
MKEEKVSYKEKLKEIIEKSVSAEVLDLPQNTLDNIKILSDSCFSQKGVYTVFVTLCIYKIVYPSQDIRNHQTQIPNGFSGRSIDTSYITPTLRELGLPSMAESGWLTRSLEQPYSYTLDYEGKISNKNVKKAFLELIDDIQVKNINIENILMILFKQIITLQSQNQIKIQPLENPDNLTISKLVEILDKQFSFKYEVAGGSKLPVLAFYSIYQLIIKEIGRYKNSILKPLGSHTACDKSSKSAGDIEIFKDNFLYEAIEIKLDKQIDSQIIRVVKEKIEKFNPTRYYVLSYYEIKSEDKDEIQTIIDEVKNIHGCQIVANGLLNTLKYYFRLIENLDDFINIYSDLVQNDKELKIEHKIKWNKLVGDLNNGI